jgi:RNA polymerase sigma-70 factor (ECF subfamily)
LISLGDSLLACHGSLYRYARALSHDPARAEELVQETYKRALAAKRSPNPPEGDTVRAWAFTIMRHIWQNQMRHSQIENAAAPDEEPTDPSPDTPETLFNRKLLRSEIVHAIDSLPPLFREVIILRELEDLSYDEMAHLIGCPRGTVMSRLSRARNILRKMLVRFAPSEWEVQR